MKRSFAFAVLLFSLGLAAGGCATSPDDSTQGTTGTQGSTGTFHGSCTTTFADGSVYCSEDYHNSPAWMKQQCAEASTATAPTAYSADHCSTVGLTGKCTLWDWVNCYYNESDSASTLQESCTNFGGTWSTS